MVFDVSESGEIHEMRGKNQESGISFRFRVEEFFETQGTIIPKGCQPISRTLIQNGNRLLLRFGVRSRLRMLVLSGAIVYRVLWNC